MVKPLKVLVACEYSGATRDAFTALGHDATSCDLLPSDVPHGKHYEGDVTDILNQGWDLMVAHPPCTYLTVASNRWLYHPDDKELPTTERRPHPNYPNRRRDQARGLAFVQFLMDAPIEKIAVENPVSVISSCIRKPDQVIQPYQFGHPERKATCLWLKNLPKLTETENVYEYMMTLPKNERERIWSLPPSPDRWKLRSETFKGIASAFALQWGGDAR